MFHSSHPLAAVNVLCSSFLSATGFPHGMNISMLKVPADVHQSEPRDSNSVQAMKQLLQAAAGHTISRIVPCLGRQQLQYEIDFGPVV